MTIVHATRFYLGQFANEVLGIGVLDGLHDFFCCDVTPSVLDILLYGASEQHWLLTHHSYLSPQPLHVHLPDVDAIQLNLKFETLKASMGLL